MSNEQRIEKDIDVSGYGLIGGAQHSVKRIRGNS